MNNGYIVSNHLTVFSFTSGSPSSGGGLSGGVKYFFFNNHYLAKIKINNISIKY